MKWKGLKQDVIDDGLIIALHEINSIGRNKQKPHWLDTTEIDEAKMNTVDNTLQERGTRYGEFHEHARITQNIKRAMQDSPNWSELPDDMKEALEMVAHKAGRILNGDPNYDDSWHDIIGYTRLVEQRLKGE